ncbi:hypothetical protein GQX74_010001 [Glossina fuscipes]|nr:hypothetical protein GQX74_010001 [Glossina fuscipes]
MTYNPLYNSGKVLKQLNPEDVIKTRGAILPTKRILGRQEYARQETWGFNHVPEIAMRLNLSIIAALNSPNFVERKEGLIHRSQDSTVTVILSVLSFSSDLRAIKASFNDSIDNCNFTFVQDWHHCMDFDDCKNLAKDTIQIM